MRNYKRWSEKETTLLRQLYPTTPITDLVNKLGRSPKSIWLKAIKLGVRRQNYKSRITWTDGQINLLRQLYSTTPIKDLVHKLGHPQRSIVSKAHELHIAGSKIWSQAEIAYLRELYPTEMRAEDIGKQIGRTRQAVSMKARVLGISGDGVRLHHWHIACNDNLVESLNETDCAYIAGLVDGEGHIQSSDGHGTPTAIIKIFNTDFTMLRWVQRKCGGHIRVYPNKNPHIGTKPVGYWVTDGKARAMKLLKRLEPYLITKKENCRRALREVC